MAPHCCSLSITAAFQAKTLRRSVVLWCCCPVVCQLHEWFDDVGDEASPPAGQDVSAEQWLRSKGATPLQLEVADVCYANDFGCSLQQLGLREMITENQR